MNNSRIDTKKLLFFLLGFLLISVIVYITILRHDGYIFFWDLSGSFDFRDPFGQYFKLETAYDGLNVGVRNRLPIAAVIYLIDLPLQLLSLGTTYTPIKIAVFLMFVGAYSAFFFSFPGFITHFSDMESPKKGNSLKKNYLLYMILSILYLMIPWYAARTSQLHLFYFSIFYPLGVIAFIKLIEKESFSLKLVLYFVLVSFFGLNSPHIIIILMVTYIFLMIPKMIKDLLKGRFPLSTLKNLALAATLIFITNLYWLIPYIVVGTPQPGYLINENMTAMLAQNSNTLDTIIGQGDWYTQQADLNVIDLSRIQGVQAMQFMGLASLYILAIFHIFKEVKNKYVISMTVLSLLSLALIITEIPFQKEVFDMILYSPVGWVVREPNKLQIVSAFWAFIFFSLYIYRTYTEEKVSFISSRFVPTLCLVSFFVYALPINITYLAFLRPYPIEPTAVALFERLGSRSKLSYVHFYPINEPFELEWGNMTFNIADTTEYKFLPYNSPLPPTQISTVVPNQRSFENLLADYVLTNWNNLDHPEEILDWASINHIVIRKDGVPVLYDKDTLDEHILRPITSTLDNSRMFNMTYENSDYKLYSYEPESSLRIKQFRFKTYESFDILHEIPIEILKRSDIVFCDFEKYHPICTQSNDIPTLVRTTQTTDIIETYTLTDPDLFIYPGNIPKTYGLQVDWGGASQQDRINGEFHNVLRAHGIDTWDFNVDDTVAYSDLNIDTYRGPAILTLPEKACDRGCYIYAKILHSRRGGRLQFNLGSQQINLNTNVNQDPKFDWIYIGNEQSTFISKIRAESGFQAIATIAIIPEQKHSMLQTDQNNIVTLKDVGLYELSGTVCSISNEKVNTGFVRSFSADVLCNRESFSQIKTFTPHGQFVISNDNMHYANSNRFSISEGSTELTVYEASIFDMISLPLVILAFNSIVVSLVVIQRKQALRQDD